MSKGLSYAARSFAYGPPVAEDLTSLLLWLRVQEGVRESIREIGHFVAHREGRDNGIVLEHVDDLLTKFRFLVDADRGVFPDREGLIAKLRATFRLEPEAERRRLLGLSEGDARQSLEKLIRKIRTIEQGQIVLTSPFSEKEKKVYNHYLEVHYNYPRLTEESLTLDLANELVERDLLDEDLKSKVLEQSLLISKYVMVKLQGVELKFAGRDESVELVLGRFTRPPNERVPFAASYLGMFAVGRTGNLAIANPVYDSRLISNFHGSDTVNMFLNFSGFTNSPLIIYQGRLEIAPV